jgi:Spy/CpxP family protein refolding chaperone
MKITWAVLTLAVLFGSSAWAQDAKPKDTPKTTEKSEKSEAKAKGQLPQNWKLLGLTDEQTQKVYKMQAKTNDEIDKLEAQIKDLKEKLMKDRLTILTAEQKKRLEDILKEKAVTDKSDK